MATPEPSTRVPGAPAPQGAFAQALGERFDLRTSIGGPRGVLESVLPVTVFSVVYGVVGEIVPSVVAALVPSVVLATWRLVAREPLSQSVSGVLGVAIGAFVAVRTGRAEGFFLPGILKNLAYAAGCALSVLARWPVVGVAAGLLLGEGTAWRGVPARARVYAQATWVWVGLFVVRVAVQLPLYLAGAATVLGFVNIVLGIPLFGLALWATWVLVRRVPPAVPAAVPPAAPSAVPPAAD